MQRLLDELGGRGTLARVGIPHAHGPSSAREDVCPRTADEPGADDGGNLDPCLRRDDGIHSQSTLLLNSMSLASAREGPTCVTLPRSSATVRSESASARSR